MEVDGINIVHRLDPTPWSMRVHLCLHSVLMFFLFVTQLFVLYRAQNIVIAAFSIRLKIYHEELKTKINMIQKHLCAREHPANGLPRRRRSVVLFRGRCTVKK